MLEVAAVGRESRDDDLLVAAAGAEEKHLPLAPRLLGDAKVVTARRTRREPLVRILGMAAIGVGPFAQGIEQLVDNADLGLAPVHLYDGGADARALLRCDRHRASPGRSS